jgi:hypothetical protein
MKKTLGLVVILVVALVAFSGCTGQGADDGKVAGSDYVVEYEGGFLQTFAAFELTVTGPPQDLLACIEKGGKLAGRTFLNKEKFSGENAKVQVQLGGSSTFFEKNDYKIILRKTDELGKEEGKVVYSRKVKPSPAKLEITGTWFYKDFIPGTAMTVENTGDLPGEITAIKVIAKKGGGTYPLSVVVPPGGTNVVKTNMFSVSDEGSVRFTLMTGHSYFGKEYIEVAKFDGKVGT